MLAHEEHIAQLSEEFYRETTTPKRQSAILREDTRTRQGIAILQDLINYHEEDMQFFEENQQRRKEEIRNVVNFVLYHPGVE